MIAGCIRNVNFIDDCLQDLWEHLHQDGVEALFRKGNGTELNFITAK